MLVYDFTPLEVFSCSIQEIKDNQAIVALMSNLLSDLKFMFYSTFKINVPSDILNEIDSDYIKKNISDCLLIFYNASEINQSISLTNLFFKCKKCEQWAYFIFLDYKGICESCVNPQEPVQQRKEEGLFAWKK
jgi:hypothetical protein